MCICIDRSDGTRTAQIDLPAHKFTNEFFVDAPPPPSAGGKKKLQCERVAENGAEETRGSEGQVRTGHR